MMMESVILALLAILLVKTAPMELPATSVMLPTLGFFQVLVLSVYA
jgi:hypothetical protein